MTKEEQTLLIKRLKDILKEATETDNAVCYVTADDADTLKAAIEELEQEPCDKCVYSTSEGCQYDDITEAMPPVSSSENPNKSECEHDHEILKAYSDGASAVLDKVRAEIDEQYDRVHPYDISCAEGLEMALNIVDKYKAEGSGE